MTTAEITATDKAATVAAQGAHVAPEKAPVKKAASHKKGAPKAKKTAKGAKAEAATPKKAAKAGAKVSKKAARPERKAAAPRAESKGAKILEMIARAKGATLAEIMKATDWQAHSVRGFVSTASKKHGVNIDSAQNNAGERVYRIASSPPDPHRRRFSAGGFFVLPGRGARPFKVPRRARHACLQIRRSVESHPALRCLPSCFPVRLGHAPAGPSAPGTAQDPKNTRRILCAAPCPGSFWRQPIGLAYQGTRRDSAGSSRRSHLRARSPVGRKKEIYRSHEALDNNGRGYRAKCEKARCGRRPLELELRVYEE